MISIRQLIVFASSMAVAACMTPEQRAAQMQREVDQMIVTYGPACDKLGYVRDTDSWRDCVLEFYSRNKPNPFTDRATATTCIGHRGFYQCTTM